MFIPGWVLLVIYLAYYFSDSEREKRQAHKEAWAAKCALRKAEKRLKKLDEGRAKEIKRACRFMSGIEKTQQEVHELRARLDEEEDPIDRVRTLADIRRLDQGDRDALGDELWQSTPDDPDREDLLMRAHMEGLI